MPTDCWPGCDRRVIRDRMTGSARKGERRRPFRRRVSGEPLAAHPIEPVAQSLHLTFFGDVLSTNADNLQREFLAPIKTAGWPTLILDLSAAKMVGSVGLNLIVGLHKEAKKRSAKTRALVTSPHIRRTFAFTRLDTHIQIETGG